MIDFFPQEHKQVSDKKRFGICDTPPPPARKAYIDHENEPNWIAVVKNPGQDAITFIPVDNCIEIKKPDGKMDKRCDGFLYYGVTIILSSLSNGRTRAITGSKRVKSSFELQ
jgi:hypothetical protein